MNRRLLKKQLGHAKRAHQCFRAQIECNKVHIELAHDIIESALKLIPESSELHKDYKTLRRYL